MFYLILVGKSSQQISLLYLNSACEIHFSFLKPKNIENWQNSVIIRKQTFEVVHVKSYNCFFKLQPLNISFR